MPLQTESFVRRLLIWIIRLPILLFKLIFNIYTIASGGFLYESAAKNVQYRRDLANAGKESAEEYTRRVSR